MHGPQPLCSDEFSGIAQRSQAFRLCGSASKQWTQMAEPEFDAHEHSTHCCGSNQSKGPLVVVLMWRPMLISDVAIRRDVLEVVSPHRGSAENAMSTRQSVTQRGDGQNASSVWRTHGPASADVRRVATQLLKKVGCSARLRGTNARLATA